MFKSHLSNLLHTLPFFHYFFSFSFSIFEIGIVCNSEVTNFLKYVILNVLHFYSSSSPLLHTVSDRITSNSLTIESRDTISEKDDDDDDEKMSEEDRQTDRNSEKENMKKRYGREKEREGEGGRGMSRRISTLTLVDLAGSENVKTATLPTSSTSSSTSISTLASNAMANAAISQRMLEGRNINQSLHALNNVFLSITDPKGVFVNFRGSKLTQLLQSSLNGNSNISIVCCITPSKM